LTASCYRAQKTLSTLPWCQRVLEFCLQFGVNHEDGGDKFARNLNKAAYSPTVRTTPHRPPKKKKKKKKKTNINMLPKQTS